VLQTILETKAPREGAENRGGTNARLASQLAARLLPLSTKQEQVYSFCSSTVPTSVFMFNRNCRSVTAAQVQHPAFTKKTRSTEN
jgi:hypothetical protein